MHAIGSVPLSVLEQLSKHYHQQLYTQESDFLRTKKVLHGLFKITRGVASMRLPPCTDYSHRMYPEHSHHKLAECIFRLRPTGFGMWVIRKGEVPKDPESRLRGIEQPEGRMARVNVEKGVIEVFEAGEDPDGDNIEEVRKSPEGRLKVEEVVQPEDMWLTLDSERGGMKAGPALTKLEGQMVSSAGS